MSTFGGIADVRYATGDIGFDAKRKPRAMKELPPHSRCTLKSRVTYVPLGPQAC
jgi:hypothetical protein